MPQQMRQTTGLRSAELEHLEWQDIINGFHPRSAENELIAWRIT
jgi:hypothetical protein